MNEDACVRLYNKSGEHICSILACGFSQVAQCYIYDIALPNGKVKYCGVEAGLVETFVELFHAEPIS